MRFTTTARKVFFRVRNWTRERWAAFAAVWTRAGRRSAALSRRLFFEQGQAGAASLVRYLMIPLLLTYERIRSVALYPYRLFLRRRELNRRYEALLRQMGVPSDDKHLEPWEERARQRTRQTAWEMAKKGGYNRSRIERESVPSDGATTHRMSSTPSSAPEKPDAAGKEDAPEMPSSLSAKRQKSDQSVSVGKTLKKVYGRERPKTASKAQIRVTTDEQREAAMRTDHTVVPVGDKVSMELADIELITPPRRSEIAKTDTMIGGYWEENPNTSEEVQEAARQPIVDAQKRTIIEHLIQAKPTIQGPPDLVERARRWFEVELPLQSQFTRGLDQYINQSAVQLLNYGSAIVFKQRSLSRKLQPYTDPVTGSKRAPVWGFGIPDAATIECFLDDFGRPRKWRQNPTLRRDGRAKEYPARDVHVLKLPTKNNSLYFWTPTFMISALYAINVLRELQKEIESHAKAVVDIRYYAKVGNKDWINGEVTPTMIRDTKRTIDGTPRGGTPVFPWTIDLEKLDVDEYLERLISAAEYWKNEVRLGIGGSQLTEGKGNSSNRNTAESLTDRDMRSAASLVPTLQRGFRWLMWSKLFEWSEAGEIDFDWRDVTSYEDIPHLVFSEIDLAEQIRRETHALNLYQGDAINHGELREKIQMDVDTERADTYWSEIQMEQTAHAEKIKAQMNPSNQHGEQTKPKRPKDAVESVVEAARARDLSIEDQEALVHALVDLTTQPGEKAQAKATA